MSDLDTLLSEREISRGLARFARVIDGKRWHELGSVFAEHVSFDYGSGGVQHGLPALERQMRQFLDHCGPTQHLIGSIQVDIAGYQAESRAYVQARHQRIDDRNGPVFDTNGEYVDSWHRGAEGWRIVHRHAIWAAHSGDPAIIYRSSPGEP